jgi:hypothetical protein
MGLGLFSFVAGNKWRAPQKARANTLLPGGLILVIIRELPWTVHRGTPRCDCESAPDETRSLGFLQACGIPLKGERCLAPQSLTDTTKGVNLKSPGGTRYRIKVADDGTLSTESTP